MGKWTVYILQCGDGTLYTGIASDVQRRFQEHQCGKGAKYTRGRGPLTLKYTEECDSKSDALKRELAIKALKKTKKEALIQK